MSTTAPSTTVVMPRAISLQPSTFRDQWLAHNLLGQFVGVVYRMGRWNPEAGDTYYHDQGTCPQDGYPTPEAAAAAMDPQWRYVDVARPKR